MARSSRLFDRYIMVDWSAGDRRRSGRQDCICIAHGAASDLSPATISPRSRTEAERIIRAELRGIISRDERVLLCADFDYGYPAGFASVLPVADRREMARGGSCGITCASMYGMI